VLFSEVMQIMLNPTTIIFMISGVIGGLIVGAIPGLTATMAMALITPLTFALNTNQAFALLCAVYVGGISGGLYSAILLGIPGTSASIATTFEGFPLARKGMAGKAIGVGIVSSFIGGTFSFICLALISPLLARFALKFGPHEYFAVSVLGLSTIASVVAGSSTTKGLIACLIGLLAATVGLDRVVGVQRFTFGLVELTSGFDVMSILIGLFAIPQLLRDMGSTTQQVKVDVEVKNIIPPLRELVPHWFNFLRSSVIGTWIGILPGAGGSIASLLSYDQARRASPHPEKFGSGEISGLVASETANNAVIGGSIIPLLTLGIPGDTPAAVMLGALMIHGLQPGPLLFQTHPDTIQTILFSLYISNIMMIVIAFFGARYLIKILEVPKDLLLPLIIVMCFVGTYAANQRMYDVWVMLIAGLIGYVMEKYGYPVGPAVLGVVLGPIVEANLRRAIHTSVNGFWDFFTRPLSAVMLLMVLFNFLWPLIRSLRARKSNLGRVA
jgi:putative tricarboxylic transport membrane protein